MTNNKDAHKGFGLSNLSLANSTSVFVIVFIILIAGLVSYNTMPKESFPEIKQPIIYIGVVYPGNSPVDMENLITRPIEKEIKSVSRVKKFTSTSIQDYSTIVVEFELDVTNAKALQDVKDAVDKAKTELPNDLPSDPTVFELDFSEFPVMNINMAGDYSYEVMKDNAEYLEEEIEKLQEISGVDIRGLLEREVRIDVDRLKMEALEISFGDIENAIAGENVTMSGGEILSVEGRERNRRTLRIAGEFAKPHEILDVIVKDENQRIVYLRDIAEVSFAQVEPTSFARLDGKQVVSLDVKKKSGENLLNAESKIQQILEKAKKTKLPRDMNIVITNNQSVFTREMVSSLENNIISGVILVVMVLLFFLGTRSALFVGTAIPLSMLLGIAVLNMMGTTLNMMVLFSLILALGMLVDNGIVVVENIYRHYSEGHGLLEASRVGVGEVAVPIIASTLTTLAAFFPLLFWKDLMGEFMKYLPITLIITLSASLFVALVINPVLTSKFMKIEQAGHRTSLKKFIRINSVLFIIGLIFIFAFKSYAIGNLLILAVIISVLSRYIFQPFTFKFQDRILPKIENAYERFLTFALKGWNPVFFFGGTFLLMILSMMFYFGSNPKVLFFPENEPQYVNIFVEMPLGTDIERTNELTLELENKIAEVIKPYDNIVEAMLAQVGEGTSDPNEGPSQGSSPHKARITVSFIPTSERVKVTKVSTAQVMKEIRDALEDIPEASIVVQKNNDGPPVGKPINVELAGDNYDTLIKYSTAVRDLMIKANVPGVDQLKTDLELDKPEVVVKINRDAARRFGVSTYQVANTIRTALFGREVSKYKEGEDDYKIQLRLRPEDRYDLNNLLNQKITFRNPSNGQISQVPISAVASVEFGSSYGSVKRKDMNRVVTVFSEVKEGYNANEIVNTFKGLLENYEMPEGYTLKFTGEQEEQAGTSSFLGNAFMIAFLIIFLIIVAQFNSVLSPAVIMFSVIFSTTGVFLGLAIFRMEFVILMMGIGIISLAGVAVNNAIVLIDYANLIRSRLKEEQGLEQTDSLTPAEYKRSIIESGKKRLRPVLLTAITTVLGLIPLAIGLNINFFTLLGKYDPEFYIGGDSVMFWGPMSWTIIFGLTFATFLTLVVVPVMMLGTDRITLWFRKIASNKATAGLANESLASETV